MVDERYEIEMADKIARIESEWKETSEKLKMSIIEYAAFMGIESSYSKYDSIVEQLWTMEDEISFEDEVNQYLVDNMDDFFQGNEDYGVHNKKDLLKLELTSLFKHKNRTNGKQVRRALIRYGVEFGPKQALHDYGDYIESAFDSFIQYVNRVSEEIIGAI